MTTYYKILDLDEKATDIEIKKSYKKLANKYHPDKNKDKGAEDQFKKIKTAYETLSDKSKRRNYDINLNRHTHSAQSRKADHGFGNYNGFGFSGFDTGSQQSDSEIFEDFFRSRGDNSNRKKDPININVFIDIRTAFNGGYDYIENNNGTKFKIKIPNNTKNNTKLCLKNKGSLGEDLIVTLIYKNDKSYYIENDLVILKQNVPIEHLLVGGSIETELLNKTVNLKIKPCTQNNSRMRIPKHSFNEKDLFVELNAVIPQTLNPEQITKIKEAFFVE